MFRRRRTRRRSDKVPISGAGPEGEDPELETLQDQHHSSTRQDRRTARVLGATIAGAVLIGTVQAPPASAGSKDLAFDLPSRGTLRGTPRKVFAHYMPSLPISFDNRAPSADYWTRHYLNPNGERGKHAAYGGFTRDRPLGRSPRPESSWRLSDMKTEVRQAIRAGIDGFSVDLLTIADGHPNARNVRLLLQAAHSVDPGFRIMLVPDMTTSVGAKSPDRLAADLAALARYPATFRLADGRLVVSPFKAEVHSVAWWKQFISVMRAKHGIRVAFVPQFLDLRANLDRFSPISYGMSHWGTRNPAWNNPDLTAAGSTRALAKAVRSRGMLWMQPVSYQDERPRSGVYEEAQNTRNLRFTWLLAMRTRAEWVQVVTWNDYVEGSHVAPSARRGWVPLDISAFYLTWFKTGRRPPIKRNAVYLTHRRQLWSVRPTYNQSVLMRVRGGSPPRNTVEAITFFRTKASVWVKVGGVTRKCIVPRGVGVCTVPLRPGRVSVRVTRLGRLKAAVASPYAVSRTPFVQDLQYVSVGSRRQGSTYR